MINIGVIGVGKMGENHARILATHKLVENAYVFDLNQRSVDRVASDTGCIPCSTLDSLFSLVDAVIIATPTSTHFEIAKKSMEYGLHTLIEKPICKTLDEAEGICSIAEMFDDLIVGVGHIERFNPVSGVLSKTIKNPKYVKFMRHNPGSDRINDANVIEDLMIHDIDLVSCFIGINFDNAKIVACGDDNTNVCMIWDKFPIILSASRTATKKTRTIYVEDESYTIVADLADQSVYVYFKPEQYTLTSHGSFVNKINLQRIEPLYNELTAFLNCIKDKKPFPVSPRQGLSNLALCKFIESCNIKNSEFLEEP